MESVTVVYLYLHTTLIDYTLVTLPLISTSYLPQYKTVELLFAKTPNAELLMHSSLLPKLAISSSITPTVTLP